jgi:hypothetical protein
MNDQRRKSMTIIAAILLLIALIDSNTLAQAAPQPTLEPLAWSQFL